MKAGDKIILAEEVNGKISYKVKRIDSVSPNGDLKLNGRNETFDSKGKEKGKPGGKTEILPNSDLVQAMSRSSFQRDTSKIKEIFPNKGAEDILRNKEKF